MSICKRGPPTTIHDIDNDNAVAVALNISDVDNAVGGALNTSDIDNAVGGVLNISDITITITPDFIFRHLSTGGTPRPKPMDPLVHRPRYR